jgi:hypothetical protein
MSITVIALLAAALIGLNPATWYSDPDLPAVQTVYQDGAPHTDRQGRALLRYDAARSFFPIAIYHGLSGDHHGVHYDFNVLKDSGFNTVHGWEGQDFTPLLAAASQAGLQLIHHNPTDADLELGRENKAMLAWYLDEEPTLRAWDSTWEERLARFVARRAEIQQRDPGRAVFTLDTPYIDPPWWKRWRRWANAGDVSAHWNYPLRGDESATLSGRRGVGETVTTAVDAVSAQKPVWLTVQAFASPLADWRMPSEAALRAMVYGGVAHGATGIVYFAYDSFVTRDGQVIGVAPTTARDYGDAPDYNQDGEPPLTASPAEQAQSRALWKEIRQLNRELAQLSPAILSPTSPLSYDIKTSREGAPVRTLLKDLSGELVLFAVNMDRREVDVRFQFSDIVGAVRPFFGGGQRAASGDWREEFEPFEVKIFTISKRTGS